MAAIAEPIPAYRRLLPNALTIARLAAIPIVAALILSSDSGYSVAAAVVFGLAGITDQIDGYLARRWHVESAFGKIADPLADRLMIDVAVVLLWHAGRLPWLALVIPARDVLLILATPLVMRRGYAFEVNFLGKLATWGFYLSLALTMVTPSGTQWPLVLFWISVGIAVVSLVLYIRRARGSVRSSVEPGVPRLKKGVSGGDMVSPAGASVRGRWWSTFSWFW